MVMINMAKFFSLKIYFVGYPRGAFKICEWTYSYMYFLHLHLNVLGYLIILYTCCHSYIYALIRYTVYGNI